ncbi:MAG TPA: TonB-dependent receptor [Syntrophorhabdaceae bacterium]|nr:TonB-dependent receptor [Syntrophorhabdaceae bacterium]
MKKGMIIILSFIIFLVCFSFINLHAQESTKKKKDYNVFTLGEIYVTGEKLPATKEVTQATEITAEEIEASNSKTVAEALNFVEGIRVSTGRKSEPNIQIHGFDQSRALILIDGVPYYETNYGKLDLNVIPVDNIAKIEVEKGVSSVLYGPNGMAGVINIVTKKPTDKPTIDALIETGDYRSNKFSVSHGMKINKFSYWLNYSHQEARGWYMSHDFDPRPGQIGYKNPTLNIKRILEDGGVRDNSATRTNSIWAKVGVEPSTDSEYYLNFHYIERYKESPSSIGTILTNTVFRAKPMFSQFTQIPKYDNWGVDLSGQEKLGDLVKAKAKLFYHYHVDDYVSYYDETYMRPIAVSRYEDSTIGGSLLSDIKLASIDTLKLSFHFRRDSHKERDDEYLPFDESVSHTGSVGLENELNLSKNFSVVAGLAYDWFNVVSSENSNLDKNGNFINRTKLNTPDYDSKLNPMIGATFTFTNGTKVFGSAARKIRFPTLQQLYSSKGGNIDLTAEKSWNYVLGVSRELTKYARGELSLFCHDISDFITRDVPTIDGKYMNIGKIRMVGFELSGEVNPAKDLGFKLGYTYNNATDRSPGRVTNRVLNVPEHKVDLTMKYLVPVVGVRLDMTGLYMGQSWGQLPTSSSPTTSAEKTNDYLIFNARVSKTIWKNVEAYFAVNNILDKNYETELDFPAPGRNMFLGIKASY